MILGRLEILVEHQGAQIQALEGQLEWVQNRQALCPCIRLSALVVVDELTEEEAS